jgi:catechol 2,3-dioxygenase-like lactoylglutathione lyase family enzyme
MAFTTGMLQINVTDVHAARTFYRDTLGMEIREPFGADGPFELDLGPGPTVFVYQVAKSVPVEYGEQTGLTLVIHTDDLEGNFADWSAKGVEFIRIPWSEEESGIAGCPYGRFIAFRDPFGNVHELLQPHAG